MRGFGWVLSPPTSLDARERRGELGGGSMAAGAVAELLPKGARGSGGEVAGRRRGLSGDVPGVPEPAEQSAGNRVHFHGFSFLF